MDRIKATVLKESGTEETFGPPADVSDESFDLSNIEKHGPCSQCRKLTYERFTLEERGSEASFVHHESVLSLQQSARHGCPFCMFLWKQLDVSSASRFPRCKVVLEGVPWYNGTKCKVKFTESGEGWSTTPWQGSFHIDMRPSEDRLPLKPLIGDTGTCETMQRIKDWITDCDVNHPQCLIDREEAFIPTRLLDVSQWFNDKTVRLIAARDLLLRQTQYTALSHRWNDQVQKTSTRRINAAVRQEFFEATTLPHCFKDAFEVTIHLGLKYIWIDSLCIVQDLPADWELEASLMSRIYRNAHCTISASLRCNESAGLFRKFSIENDLVSFELVDEKGKSRSATCHRSWKEWEELIVQAPLHTRGWCFQERQLSPRVVHWTEEQVVWECRGRTATEHSPWMQPKFWQSNGPYRTFNTITETPAANLFQVWHSTIEQYARRELSRSGDRFPALGGLARVMNARLKSAYVAGMWLANLEEDLLWFRRNVAKRPGTYIAPSWSWASLNGQISVISEQQALLIASGSKTNPTNLDLAVITDYTIDLSTSDPYGALSSGALFIKTPLVTCHLGLVSSRIGYADMLETSTGKRIIGNLILDVLNEVQQLDVVKCIALRLYSIPRKGVKVYQGIALVPVRDSKNTYRRVGYVSDLKMEVFTGVEIEDIVVI